MHIAVSSNIELAGADKAAPASVCFFLVFSIRDWDGVFPLDVSHSDTFQIDSTTTLVFFSILSLPCYLTRSNGTWRPFRPRGVPAGHGTTEKSDV